MSTWRRVTKVIRGFARSEPRGVDSTSLLRKDAEAGGDTTFKCGTVVAEYEPLQVPSERPLRLGRACLADGHP
jgi:hypothetical protein